MTPAQHSLLEDLLREHLRPSTPDLLVLPLRALHVLPGAFPWEDRAAVDEADLARALYGSTWRPRNARTAWTAGGVLVVAFHTTDPHDPSAPVSLTCESPSGGARAGLALRDLARTHRLDRLHPLGARLPYAAALGYDSPWTARPARP